ncbi:MAG: hypothetical protein M3R59_02050 [Verrucomicrobiota bacterium]|nr:hypothetical protein [Verrucomicrobiota bacterium]
MARAPWRIGWEAAKQNAVPAFILQAAMLSLLLGYYFHPPTARALSALADFKLRHGLAFVLIASVMVGAVLPELFVIFAFQRGRFRRQNLLNFLFNAPFWAFDGFLVNIMYRVLAIWFCERVSLPMVAGKILIDQLGYNPFFAAPYGIWGYAWKNGGYSWQKLRPLLTWEYYRVHALPVLVATWAVWVPLMAIIYSLPFALQFPLFALALAFWVLMMTYMTNRFAEKPDALITTPVEVPGSISK